jgi:hypothetical protein
MLFRPTRVRDLVVLVVSVHKILQDRAAFPDLELLAVLICVDDGWNATVGVDVEIPLLFLLVFKKLDRMDLYCENVSGLYVCCPSHREMWSGLGNVRCTASPIPQGQ